MYLFFYFLLTGILIWAALYGKKPGWTVIVLLISALVSIWIFCHTGREKNSLTRRKNFRFSGKQGAYIGISMALMFSLSSAAVLFRPAIFYDLVYRAESRSVRTFRQITGRGREPIAEGMINRGNHYRSGIVHLEITASEAPKEALYLKGFCGGVYTDSHWEEADEETVLREVSREMGWDDWYSMIDGMHYTMHFMLNRGTIREEAPLPITISIQHRNGDYSDTFMPYYSRKGRIGSAEGDMKTEGYIYQYYELQDVEIAWDERLWVRERLKEWYRLFQETYAEKAQEAFTQVPEEQLPGLRQLVEENPQKDLGDITAFICYLLQNHTVYTLTPGRAPVNRDIVEYFLLESRQGYCQHYASAATLLYRMYGVPARYVSGYMIQPSNFEKQEDGTWTAEVTDESAHAWVEILLDDYGWMPVEVTPAEDGSIPMPFQEYDSAALRQITAGVGEPIRFREWEESGPGRMEKQSEEGFFYLFDVERYREVYLVLGTCLLCGLSMVPVLLDYRRLRSRWKMEQMGCRKIFAVMMEMFHYAGYFSELEGWEKDFPRRVSREFPQVSEEEMQRLQNIVKEAAYGPAEASAEDGQFVRWVYFRMVEQVLQRLKGFRKQIFRYGKGFG